MPPVLVTAYISPDLDGVAGCVAYAEYLQQQGVDAIAGIMGTPHDEAKFVLGRFGFDYPLLLENGADYADAILVDASDVAGLEGRLRPEQVVEIIDHRQIHEAGSFPRAKVQIELVGAAATLVAEKFMYTGCSISRRSAALLQAAIISNTLNLKGTITTPHDIAAHDWLQLRSSLPEDFWHEQFIAKSDVTGNKLQERLAGEVAIFVFGQAKVIVYQLELLDVAAVLKARLPEIRNVLEYEHADYVFLNAIDIGGAHNTLVAFDDKTQQLLRNALEVNFQDSMAVLRPALFRKQIMPHIKRLLAG